MIGIYKIENKVNGKVYIGQSIDITTRWYNHRSELNGNRHHNEHLQRAWNKYGEDNFNFEIIEECELNVIDNKEMFWISFFNSATNNFGYNITLGGQGTHGVKKTQEQKEQLSATHNPTPILQIDLNGKVVERWRSGSYAARETGIPVSGIMNCVREDGDQYQCHGFIWISEEKFYDTNFNIYDYINAHIVPSPRIIEYDLYGKQIKIWNGLFDIGIVYGRKSNVYKTIPSILRHQKRSVDGKIYLYENDTFELSEGYLRDVRIKTGNYKINQYDEFRNFIKTWTIEEIKNSKFKFGTVRKCCTDNLLGYKVNGTAFSYIWEYE